jgi:predicted anti-sigma-YlaC factor YlaD
MKCNEFKRIIAGFFDDDRLKKISNKQLDHLQKCANCREYYDSLIRIDENIHSLSHQLTSGEGDQQILKSLKEGIRDRLERQNQGIFSGSRRMIAIVATFLILMLLIILPWMDRIKNGRSDVSKIFFLYSAEIERKPASTIIYQSNKPEEPDIIWLYVKEGEE